ncbi:hypothetical protein GYMLUDRAFT_34468 [Collybiopsis luxurians FD-317 M1]|nr:hypothetical protein GYMLUDRAFT_34468 [Collybiopsis luxurians FD-317 M1]
MIIPTNDVDDFDSKLELEDSLDMQTVHNVNLNPMESPPRYDYKPNVETQSPEKITSTSLAAAPTQGESSQVDTNFAHKAVNFVYRHIYFDSICASYAIDPDYQDPLCGGSDSREKSRRKNLFLRSDCGQIDVDVQVVHTEKSHEAVGRKPRKVTLDFRTTFGSIDVKLRAPSSRLPIRLSASSNCGAIKIYLPNTFQGFLVLSVTLGEVSLSPKIKEKMSWDNQSGKTRTIFIGDSSVLQSRLNSKPKSDMGPWAGDEAHLDATCGSVYIDFVDELTRN